MYTEIDIAHVQKIISELQRSESQLKRSYYELQETISSLRRIQEEGIQVTCKKLQGQKSTLYAEIRKTQTLRILLDRILQIYRKTESDIEDYEPAFTLYRLNASPIKGAMLNLKAVASSLDTADIHFE